MERPGIFTWLIKKGKKSMTFRPIDPGRDH